MCEKTWSVPDCSILSASGAGAIGDNTYDNAVTNALAHAALGCATAAANKQDCASGAIGGAASTVIARAVDGAVSDSGLSDTTQRALIATSSIAGSAALVGALGGEATTAAQAAENEVMNNALSHRQSSDLVKKLLATNDPRKRAQLLAEAEATSKQQGNSIDEEDAKKGAVELALGQKELLLANGNKLDSDTKGLGELATKNYTDYIDQTKPTTSYVWIPSSQAVQESTTTFGTNWSYMGSNASGIALGKTDNRSASDIAASVQDTAYALMLAPFAAGAIAYAPVPALTGGALDWGIQKFTGNDVSLTGIMLSIATGPIGLEVMAEKQVVGVGANSTSLVETEAAALRRIGQNPTGADLSLREPNSVLLTQAERISTAKAYQATAPRDLVEQALWNRVLEDPSVGRPLVTLQGDQRFAQSAGFTKMEATHRLPDGSSISIHYQYNSATGKAYDMKVVTPQRSVLQPGPSFE